MGLNGSTSTERDQKQVHNKTLPHSESKQNITSRLKNFKKASSQRITPGTKTRIIIEEKVFESEFSQILPVELEATCEINEAQA